MARDESRLKTGAENRNAEAKPWARRVFRPTGAPFLVHVIANSNANERELVPTGYNWLSAARFSRVEYSALPASSGVLFL